MKKLILIAGLTIMNMQTYAGAGAILKFIVHQPKIKSEKPPLILLLHGRGSDENDLFSFAEQLPENFLIVSARAPYNWEGGGYAWYQADVSSGKPSIDVMQAEKSRQVIIQFITELKKEFSIDEKRVYLVGFSQGAIMSYSVALTRPDLVHGIAVMSGRLLDEVKPKIAEEKKLQSLKVFISHGTNDQVLSIDYARNSVGFLKKINVIPQYKEYEAGHSINNEMLSDLINWLKKN